MPRLGRIKDSFLQNITFFCKFYNVLKTPIKILETIFQKIMKVANGDLPLIFLVQIKTFEI